MSVHFQKLNFWKQDIFEWQLFPALRDIPHVAG